MNKIVAGMVVSVVLALAAGAVISADKSQVYYVCNCADDCKCNSISREPGKCTCGKEMAAMHMLEVEKNTAVLCRCGADCSCERSKKDPNLCGCGKAVKTVDITGKYACACGYKSCVCSGGCTCNAVADKQEKCGCGKDMKKI
jgi:hypothetical protein